jgi:hypothetical protein
MKTEQAHRAGRCHFIRVFTMLDYCKGTKGSMDRAKPNALKVAHIQDGLTGETPESLRPAIRAAIRMVIVRELKVPWIGCLTILIAARMAGLNDSGVSPVSPRGLLVSTQQPTAH